MKMKKLLLNIGVISSMLLLGSGCSTDAAKKLQPNVELSEHSEVTFNINKYTDGLDNLNELLTLYGDDTINLAVEPVSNRTGGAGQELPADITMMVNSALNEIGEKVALFDYTEHTLQSKKLYIVKGAITEYDVLESSNAGVNTALHFGKGKGEADADASASDDNQVAKITLDFNIVNNATDAFVSKVRTSNSIKVIKQSASNDFGFSILGSGFGLNASASKEQGKHAAIRLLVDLSMIELIGKLKKKPYWICVPGAKKDHRLFRDIKRNFNKFTEHKKASSIVNLLNLVGKEAYTSSIVEYKKEQAIMPINEEITAELYVSLLETAHKLKQQSLSLDKSSKTFSGML